MQVIVYWAGTALGPMNTSYLIYEKGGQSLTLYIIVNKNFLSVKILRNYCIAMVLLKSLNTGETQIYCNHYQIFLGGPMKTSDTTSS